MKFTTKRLTDARQHLKDSGFTFRRYGLNMDGRGGENRNVEMYSAAGLTARLRKLPFKGFEVRIMAAAS